MVHDPPSKLARSSPVFIRATSRMHVWPVELDLIRASDRDRDMTLDRHADSRRSQRGYGPPWPKHHNRAHRIDVGAGFARQPGRSTTCKPCSAGPGATSSALVCEPTMAHPRPRYPTTTSRARRDRGRTTSPARERDHPGEPPGVRFHPPPAGAVPVAARAEVGIHVEKESAVRVGRTGDSGGLMDAGYSPSAWWGLT